MGKSTKIDNKETFVKAKKWLIDPNEKIDVIVIGCGGTGSQVLQGLARMNYALENLNHQGFHVTAFDGDIVTTANMGRQLFAESDLDNNKAAVLISKINRYYGYDWQFKAENFVIPHLNNYKKAIVLTCVDLVQIRHQLLNHFKHLVSYSSESNYYWMDFGNDKNTGQVILGEYDISKKEEICLKGIEHYGIAEKDDHETPSCSLAEALAKQDLMINTMIANTGLTMLWQAFSKLKFDYNASFINLNTMQIKSTLNYD